MPDEDENARLASTVLKPPAESENTKPAIRFLHVLTLASFSAHDHQRE
ncbi:MAG: hypothetical protein ACRD3T_05265 [Terriglobia bacterium]